MDFFEAVEARRSVRKYKPDPVSRELVMKVLHAANNAPSAVNLQQWEFIVASGERIARLGESYGRAMENAYSHIEVRDLPPREELLNFARVYGGAPLVIAVLTDAADDPAFRKAHLESASAAMENLVLAAAALGLGTCWMTGPLRDETHLRAILGVPDSQEIVAITPLGYPASVPPRKPRKDPDLSRKVTWLD